MELKTSWGAQVVPRARHGGSEVGLGADCHEVASRAHRQDSWGLCPRGKHTGKWGDVWVPQVPWQDLRSLINLCCLCSLNCKIRSNDGPEHLTRWSWGQMETGCQRAVKLGRALLLPCVSSLPGGEDTEVERYFCVCCCTYVKNETSWALLQTCWNPRGRGRTPALQKLPFGCRPSHGLREWLKSKGGRQDRPCTPAPPCGQEVVSQEAPNYPQNYPQTPVWPQSHNPRHLSPNQPPPWHLQPWTPHAMPDLHLSASARAVSSAGKLGLSPFKNQPGHPSLATFWATRRHTGACFSYRQNQRRNFACLMHR